MIIRFISWFSSNNDNQIYIMVLIKQRPKVDEAKGNLKPFTFNVVFEPEATQADVLEHSGMKRYLLSIY